MMKPRKHVEQTLRVLSVAEQADIESAWLRSDEKAMLDEKRKNLIEAISQKTAAYSPRA